MLVAAAVVPILWKEHIHTSEQHAAAYVDTLRTLMPEPQGAVPEERKDNAMPVLSLEETDFIYNVNKKYDQQYTSLANIKSSCEVKNKTLYRTKTAIKE